LKQSLAIQGNKKGEWGVGKMNDFILQPLTLIMDIKRKTELLSPAGKLEALKAAVQNGADAVYIGEKSFSARKNADNFSEEEIKEAVRYSHIRGVKVHLALNTLISDNELKSFEDAVVRAAESGVDAVIVQDIGAAKMIKKICPSLPMHASTQLTASNMYDVQALEKMGFSRVVLSRELSEKEIEHIHKNTDAELEAFVHGALCISFSGKCLMSSFIGGRSGNRGLCAQPCRKLYRAEGREAYFLSPRDLCLADELKTMIECGITSFKIEGRMKSPEYVASVTSVYRKYLDSFLPLSKEDEQSLKKIFVRGDGFTKGYFKGENTPEIMNYLISNDKLSSRADGEELKKMRYSFREGAENKKIPVSAFLSVKKGEPSFFTLSDEEGNSATEYGSIPEAAENISLTEKDAQDRMKKTGQTPFLIADFTSDIGEKLMLRAAELNRLRRDCAEKLSEIRGKIEKKECTGIEYPEKKQGKVRKKLYISVQVRTPEQFEKAKDADVILVPVSLIGKIELNEKCALVLPQVFTDEKELEKQISGYSFNMGGYASSYGGMELLKKCGIKPHADFGMNIYNSFAASEAEKNCDILTLSPELNLSEIKEIASKTEALCEAVAYGHQQVMVSRACLIRGIRNECRCDVPCRIKDKTGAEFEIYGDAKSHLNTVYNSVPTFMADKLKELEKSLLSGIRLVFTKEKPEEVKKIIKMYKGEIPPEKPKTYTRGYFLKQI